MFEPRYLGGYGVLKMPPLSAIEIAAAAPLRFANETGRRPMAGGLF
jgi:hypothetical protein